MQNPQKVITPPGPKGRFLDGLASQVRKDPLAFLQKNAREFPKISRYRSKYRHLVHLSEPDYVQHVLQTNSRSYCIGSANPKLALLVGNGLLTSNGPFWLKQRRLLQPAFQGHVLTAFWQQSIRATEEMLQNWNQSMIAVNQEMLKLTLKIASRVLIHPNFQEYAEWISEKYSRLMHSLFYQATDTAHLPLWLPIPQNRALKNHRIQLEQLIWRLITVRKKNTEKYDDLFQVLMNDVENHATAATSLQQITDESMTLFFAGQETAGNALIFILYLLARHPEITDKLRTEFHETLNGKIPSLDDLKKLTYLQQIIYEALRLYPPSWGISRRALRDDVIEHYKIYKGDNIIISQYVIHRCPRLWQEPEKFDPARFEIARMKRLHQFQYFPFGGGPRLCLGRNAALLEMAVILSIICQRYTFKCRNDKPLELMPGLTLRPHHPIWMEFYRI